LLAFLDRLEGASSRLSLRLSVASQSVSDLERLLEVSVSDLERLLEVLRAMARSSSMLLASGLVAVCGGLDDVGGHRVRGVLGVEVVVSSASSSALDPVHSSRTLLVDEVVLPGLLEGMSDKRVSVVPGTSGET
jgi:hypothetical protein